MPDYTYSGNWVGYCDLNPICDCKVPVLYLWRAGWLTHLACSHCDRIYFSPEYIKFLEGVNERGRQVKTT